MPMLAHRSILSLIAGTCLALSASTAFGQSAPETLRINVVPADPGIRSVTLNKSYRPIINRDEKGVVIDTMGSSGSLPPCDVKLEIDLQNSRVLHRSAHICSGNTLNIDVSKDGKPGDEQVVAVEDGSVPTQTAQSDTSGEQPEGQAESSFGTLESNPNAELETLGSEEQDVASGEGELKPLDSFELGNGDTIQPVDGGNGFGQPGGQLQEAVIVQPSDQRAWTTETAGSFGSRADLLHTVPGTQDADFRAACRTQSGQITIVFAQTTATLDEGLQVPVRLTAGDYSADYVATGGSRSNRFGKSFPQVVVDGLDPVWQKLISESELRISVEGTPEYAVSLKGSADQVRFFVANCNQAQQIVGGEGVTTGPQVVATGADATCANIGNIRSFESNQSGQIIFHNNSQAAVQVNWIDYNGGERPYTRLEPGQFVEQQTFVSHAWMVRTAASGECLGIYLTHTPFREVYITSGNGTGNFAGQAPNNGAFGQNNGFGQNDTFGQDNTFDQNRGFGQQQFGTQPNFDQNGSSSDGPVPPGFVGQPGVNDQSGLNGGQNFGNQGFGNQGSGFAQMPPTGVADYLCSAGVDLRVRFSPDGQSVNVDEMGQGSVVLQRVASGATLDYQGNGYRLAGQVGDMTWSRPGLADVFCSQL